MEPYKVKAYSMYGASMGRRSYPGLEGRVHLRRVPLIDGGCYDQGGAYWGQGLPLWCAWNDEGAIYQRAWTREAAKVLLLLGKPGVLTFYR